MECNVYTQIENSILSEDEIKEKANFVLDQLNQKKTSLSIHQVDDDKMKELNRKYRSKNSTTDVLSFSMREGEKIQQEGTKEDLGDIFISIPQVKRQARENSVSQENEFVRILVHGVLHLLGYDHKQEEEAEEMFSLQEDLINKIN